MDDETRFWISQQVAETKNTADKTPLFSKGKEIAGIRLDRTYSSVTGHQTFTQRLTESYTLTSGQGLGISTTSDCRETTTTTRWKE